MISQPAMAPPPDDLDERKVKAAPPSDDEGGKNVKAKPPSDASGSGNWRGELRILRSEIQDLQRALGRVQSGELTLADCTEYITQTLSDIKPGLNALRQIELKQGDDGDAIRHLLNTWEQVQNCPLLKTPTHAFKAEEQLRYLKALDVAFRELTFQVGYLTIPDRLNDWLEKARPGYYVPFHEVFADEIPVLEDRAKVLKYLSWAPNVLKREKSKAGGLVDAASGVIYRYSLEPGHQLNTLTLTILAFIAAAIFVLASVNLQAFTIPFVNWGPFYLYDLKLKPGDQSIVFTAWLAILIGIAVHVLVGTAKRAQAQGALPAVIVPADLPLWINAKFGNILLKLGLSLIAVFGYLFAVGVSQAQPGEAFLVGYSLDSFIELFSTSIEQRATAQVATLKKQLGVTET
ncbi:MAG: hypothetical protein L0Y55_15140 [Anaerolineales bacterium]|nr:hypothetical protein [Anaerolineales bacterium]